MATPGKIGTAVAVLAVAAPTGSACSVYLEGTRGCNEGRVSTPACYLLLSLARFRLETARVDLDIAQPTISSAAHAQFAEGFALQ